MPKAVANKKNGSAAAACRRATARRNTPATGGCADETGDETGHDPETGEVLTARSCQATNFNAATTPKETPLAKTQTPAPVATATEPATTVDGFAMQVLAFIPVPRKDLKKQVEISTLLIDINEGRKTVADLVPFMKNVEFRQQHAQALHRCRGQRVGKAGRR